jgi:hypothetical protein
MRGERKQEETHGIFCSRKITFRHCDETARQAVPEFSGFGEKSAVLLRAHIRAMASLMSYNAHGAMRVLFNGERQLPKFVPENPHRNFPP